MTHPTSQSSNVAKNSTFPISLEAHALARELYESQCFSKKAKKVYLNILAASVVRSYLSCFDIQTLNEPRERNPIDILKLEDSASLTIANLGEIECRPVLPNEDFCVIPLEVREHKLGFVAVLLNSELSEGTLLGFLPSQTLAQWPSEEKVDLKAFEEFSILFDAIAPEPVKSEPGQWSELLKTLDRTLRQSGWNSIAHLFEFPNREPVFSFRSASMLEKPLLLNEKYQGLRVGKKLDIRKNEEVTFALGIRPAEEGEELEINLDFIPERASSYLPPGFEVSVLDESEDVVMYKKTKQKNRNFPFQFFGSAGDSFHVRVVCGNFSMQESFILG